ncbi:hypothetical protein [Streptomyces flaveolus]|uniref:hypothetical protein n=1 Tax=Streptomyces flaveolus TaxID=67297 RepID=UPI0036F68AB7
MARAGRVDAVEAGERPAHLVDTLPAEELCAKAVAKGRTTQEKADALLARAKPSTEFTYTAPARSRAAIAAPARRSWQDTAAPRV